MELMVALAIAGVLMAIGIPRLADMLRSGRLASVSNDFYSDVMTARVEALKRGRSVTVCPSSDASSCAESWTNRRLIFLDKDDNGSFDSAEGDELIKVSDTIKGDVTVADSSSTVSSFIRFRPIGVVVGGERTFDISVPNVGTRKLCLKANGQASLTPLAANCS